METATAPMVKNGGKDKQTIEKSVIQMLKIAMELNLVSSKPICSTLVFSLNLDSFHNIITE